MEERRVEEDPHKAGGKSPDSPAPAMPIENPMMRVQGGDIILESAQKQGKGENGVLSGVQVGRATSETRKGTGKEIAASSAPVLNLSLVPTLEQQKSNANNNNKPEIVDRKKEDHSKIAELPAGDSITSFRCGVLMGKLGDLQKTDSNYVICRVKNLSDSNLQSKHWDKLTTTNMQVFSKLHQPSNRHSNLERVKKWIDESSPPYDPNPPGRHVMGQSSTAKPEHSSRRWRWLCCGV